MRTMDDIGCRRYLREDSLKKKVERDERQKEQRNSLKKKRETRARKTE
jgi:hypothetical protein